MILYKENHVQKNRIIQICKRLIISTYRTSKKAVCTAHPDQEFAAQISNDSVSHLFLWRCTYFFVCADIHTVWISAHCLPLSVSLLLWPDTLEFQHELYIATQQPCSEPSSQTNNGQHDNSIMKWATWPPLSLGSCHTLNLHLNDARINGGTDLHRKTRRRKKSSERLTRNETI